MIVTTYCTAQSLILQLISSDELLVLLWVTMIEVTVGAGGAVVNTLTLTQLVNTVVMNLFNKIPRTNE